MEPLRIRSCSLREIMNSVSEKSVLLVSVNFEDRHRGVLDVISELKLFKMLRIYLLEIEDDEGFFKKECNEIQEKNLNMLRSALGGRIISEIKCKRSECETLVAKVEGIVRREKKPVFFDISTLPKKVFFPITKFLSEEWVKSYRVVVAYAEALNYPQWLSKDPEEPSYLPGFAGLYAGGRECVWIPILGFEGGLAKKIYEHVGFSDICPVIGFPSIMVDRILYANRDIIGRLPNGLKDISYSPTNDPWETYTTIESILKREGRGDRQFMLSPLGTKAQSLGCCILAVEKTLPVMYAQPKTYHPKYSTGIGNIYAYELKKKC